MKNHRYHLHIASFQPRVLNNFCELDSPLGNCTDIFFTEKGYAYLPNFLPVVLFLEINWFGLFSYRYSWLIGRNFHSKFPKVIGKFRKFRILDWGGINPGKALTKLGLTKLRPTPNLTWVNPNPNNIPGLGINPLFFPKKLFQGNNPDFWRPKGPLGTRHPGFKTPKPLFFRDRCSKLVPFYFVPVKIGNTRVIC